MSKPALGFLLIAGLGALSCGREPARRPAPAADTASVAAPTPQRRSPLAIDSTDFEIGALSDRSDTTAVLRALGHPDSITVQPNPFDVGGKLSTWHYADINVSFAYSDTVQSLDVQGARFATHRGVRIGDGEERILAAYGPPGTREERAWTYADPAQELHQLIFIIRDGRVVRIFAGTVLD